MNEPNFVATTLRRGKTTGRQREKAKSLFLALFLESEEKCRGSSTSSSALTIGTFYIPNWRLAEWARKRAWARPTKVGHYKRGSSSSPRSWKRKPTYDNIRRSGQLTTLRGPMAGSDMSEEQVLFYLGEGQLEVPRGARNHYRFLKYVLIEEA
jgi:hypothetical protein